MQGDVRRPKLYFKSSIDADDAPVPIIWEPQLLTPTHEPLQPLQPLAINELGRRLLKASVDGNVNEIRQLLGKGAPFTADWLGSCPLHFAAQLNYLEVCEILLKAGISKDARTKVDRTPLHISAAEGHLEITKCLLRYKADLECRDLLEMTPLHWAVQNCHIDTVSLLVFEGAQVYVTNKFGLTPMEIAVQCQRYDILNVLKACIRKPTVIDESDLSVELHKFDNPDDSFDQAEMVEAELVQPGPTFLEAVNLVNHEIDEELEYAEPPESIENFDHQNINEEPKSPENSNKFTESFRLLQQHGITLIPNDNDTNILSSVLELGRSVVLTDVGKEVLNSTKPIQSVIIDNNAQPVNIQTIPANSKFVTVSTDEYLGMASNQNRMKPVDNENITVTDRSRSKGTFKRIIMTKSKVMPFGNNKVTKIISTKHNIMDVKMLVKELADAKSLAEEYKQRFLKKHAEAEEYKKQILLLTRNKNNS